MTASTDKGISTSEPTGGESPILRATWVLDSWEPVDRTFEARPGESGGTRTQRRIHFKFSAVNVLESEEPYFMPTAEVFITYANPSQSRGSTRWEAFSASGRKLFGKRPDILDLLVGKEQTWAQLPAPLREQDRETKEWGEVDRPCWQVVSVEGAESGNNGNGASGVDLYAYAIQLMSGKTEREFKQVAMSDQQVLRNANLTEEISQNQIVGKLLALGRINRDPDGVLSPA